MDRRGRRRREERAKSVVLNARLLSESRMLSRLGRTLRKRNPVYETLDATRMDVCTHRRGSSCVCAHSMNVHRLFCRYGANGQETARSEYFWNWIKTIPDRRQPRTPVASSWFRQCCKRYLAKRLAPISRGNLKIIRKEISRGSSKDYRRSSTSDVPFGVEDELELILLYEVTDIQLEG